MKKKSKSFKDMSLMTESDLAEFKKNPIPIKQTLHNTDHNKFKDFSVSKKETLEEVELAILFHNTYERLAPSFGYETREDTKLFDTTTPNGMLMIAVCKEIIKWQQERIMKKKFYVTMIKYLGMEFPQIGRAHV